MHRVEATMRREEEARSLAVAQQQQAARSKMTAASGVCVYMHRRNAPP